MVSTRSRSAVQLTDLVKRYRSGVVAVNGLTVSVEPGEIIALLGPAGGGKSTVLRVIAGRESPTSGEVLIGAEPAHVGGARHRGGHQCELITDSRFRNTLLAPESACRHLRDVVTRALASRPEVVMLDEPFGSVDARSRVLLREEVRRIHAELGITMILATQHHDDALAIADRVVVLRSGRVEQIGRPEEIYREPANAFVAEFVGQVNRLPGEVRGGFVEVYGAWIPLLTPVAPPGPAFALVRPEDIVLLPPEHGEAAPSGTTSRIDAIVNGVVVGSSFLGSTRLTSVLLVDGTQVIVQHHPGIVPQTGECVRLGFTGACVSVQLRSLRPRQAGADSVRV
ncbi:ABC transporter ATP-binding protein [Subtercola frigoramans]|uniref:Spermidine/putrescine transport system ATP-binding protein n=1 Tax=Subtercola frigoramans TaxID=120298 RepID=A0ABS2L787_9MICO|nr:ABC transporter ATP-binding protein [Subtercola frigoramans]MBM7472942.1 putative spermidine/putrescine transport system ATP-binding protein [Subtercola frigoramans]